MLTQNQQTRPVLGEIHRAMKTLVQIDEENIPTLYYYALSSILLKEIDKCKEAIDLMHKVYRMECTPGELLVIDYYKAKGDSIAELLKKHFW